MNRENIDHVHRSLRRVNIQGSFFGQTVAIRFGLSESDIQTIEALVEMGASTAGRLSELTGLTSGAVTRVVDRLERAGYVRRVPDPADRRRVFVEVVPGSKEQLMQRQFIANVVQSVIAPQATPALPQAPAAEETNKTLLTRFLSKKQIPSQASAAATAQPQP